MVRSDITTEFKLNGLETISIKPVDVDLHLLDRGNYANGRTVKMPSGHSSVLKVCPCKCSDLCNWQFWLRRVKQVLIPFDRGSYVSGRTVKMLSGHSSVLKLL